MGLRWKPMLVGATTAAFLFGGTAATAQTTTRNETTNRHGVVSNSDNVSTGNMNDRRWNREGFEGFSEQERRRIDTWISENDLNDFGDVRGTWYPNGTPLDEGMDRYRYIANRHPYLLDDTSNISARQRARVDRYLRENDLNDFGDPRGTMYPNGTPLYDQTTNQRLSRYDYILKNNPDLRVGAAPSSYDFELNDAQRRDVDEWVRNNRLNQYGEPYGTVYGENYPLRDRNGRDIDRYNYIVGNNPEAFDWATRQGDRVSIDRDYRGRRDFNLAQNRRDEIDRWLRDNDLNEYGDPSGTFYTGGTPLYNERTGQRTDRYEYILRNHPDEFDWARMENDRLRLNDDSYDRSMQTAGNYPNVNSATDTVVLLNGHRIAEIRVSAAGFTPEERWAVVQSRLQRVLADNPSPNDVGVSRQAGSAVVTLNGEDLLTATAADARANGMDNMRLAQLWADNLREALRGMR